LQGASMCCPSRCASACLLLCSIGFGRRAGLRHRHRRAIPPLPEPLARSSQTGVSALPDAVQTLGVLRDVSGILTHSLNADAMLEQFLLLLREILGIIAPLFFCSNPSLPLEMLSRLTTAALARRQCHRIVFRSIGPFQLSFDSGIGGHIFRLGASCGVQARKRGRISKHKGI